MIQSRAVVFAPTLTIRTHLWIAWAHIAIHHEQFAREARQRAEAAPSVGDALTQEFHASMVSITAVGHCLDALFGAIADFAVPETTRRAWTKNRTRRRGPVLEAIKAGFDVGSHANGWASEFAWLWDLRDKAVHFDEESREPVPHPLGSNTSPEQAMYSAEAATRAVDLLLDVLVTCTRSPRVKNEGAVGWASGMRATVAELLSIRAGLTA
jgi:hypothetical protein